jgi:cytochrome c553
MTDAVARNWTMGGSPVTGFLIGKRGILMAVAAAVALAGPPVAFADFEADLKRVDAGIRANPSRVPTNLLESCLNRRRFANELYQSGYEARATRSLKHCFGLLRIPEKAPLRSKASVSVPTAEQLQAKAKREIEQALNLTPDVARGLEIYRECAACHMPEGWGLAGGSVPQIAGQHRNVIIKQLADIRSGNRDNVLMVPYSSAEAIGGPQAVADVAAYIDTLEISVANRKGPGDDLELGERLYRENCARCHGATGEGNNETYVPRIQAQSYGYLLRQFEWIRDGKRRNANPDMVIQIQDFDERKTGAVLDYVSRLEPPAALQAPPGWKNPDFAD